MKVSRAVSLADRARPIPTLTKHERNPFAVLDSDSLLIEHSRVAGILNNRNISIGFALRISNSISALAGWSDVDEIIEFYRRHRDPTYRETFFGRYELDNTAREQALYEWLKTFAWTASELLLEYELQHGSKNPYPHYIDCDSEKDNNATLLSDTAHNVTRNAIAPDPIRYELLVEDPAHSIAANSSLNSPAFEAKDYEMIRGIVCSLLKAELSDDDFTRLMRWLFNFDTSRSNKVLREVIARIAETDISDHDLSAVMTWFTDKFQFLDEF